MVSVGRVACQSVPGQGFPRAGFRCLAPARKQIAPTRSRLIFCFIDEGQTTGSDADQLLHRNAYLCRDRREVQTEASGQRADVLLSTLTSVEALLWGVVISGRMGSHGLARSLKSTNGSVFVELIPTLILF